MKTFSVAVGVDWIYGCSCPKLRKIRADRFFVNDDNGKLSLLRGDSTIATFPKGEWRGVWEND